MPDQDPESQQIEIGAGALVGLGVIAIVQMLSMQSLDVPLTVSLYSFAVSIPSLSAVFLCMREEIKHRVYPADQGWVNLLVIIGGLASSIGIGGLFFHFDNYAGIIFIIVSVLGLVVWFHYEAKLIRRRS